MSSLSGASAPSTRRALRARRRRRRRARHAAVAATAIVATTLIGILSSGGTYAVWSDEKPLGAGILRSSTTGLAISGTISAAAFQNLLPGEVVAQQVTLVNTGGTDLALEAWVAAAAPGFELRVTMATASCGTTPLTTGGTPALVTAPLALGELTAGASRPLCVEATALAGVAPAQNAPFVITLHGVQDR